MNRTPEGEPQPTSDRRRQELDEDSRNMLNDPDYQRNVASIQEAFEASDYEAFLLGTRNYENLEKIRQQANSGFETFRKSNDLVENLVELEPRDDYKILARMAEIGGDFRRIIRLTVTRARYEVGSPLSKVDVTVEVEADDGTRFMQPKQTSQFQLDEISLGNVSRQVAPRLRRALRIAQSITDADLTESRPVLPGSRE